MITYAGDFDRRYGVKLKLWRASSVKVLARAAAEARANRWDFDAVAIASPEMEAMHRERLLQEVRSSHHADLAPDAMPAHRATRRLVRQHAIAVMATILVLVSTFCTFAVRPM